MHVELATLYKLINYSSFEFLAIKYIRMKKHINPCMTGWSLM